MARRISLSQYKSQLRQAINKHNIAVRKYNSDVNRAINKYNQQARTHNNAVRINRQKLRNAINTYNQNSKITYTISYHYQLKHSLEVLNSSYNSLESDINLNPKLQNSNLINDYPQQETTNSFLLFNAFTGNQSSDSDIESDESEINLQKTVIENQLSDVSPDLEKRWLGALYSLSTNNPDSARHFCTSVREIFTLLIDYKAPDEEVMKLPDCQYLEGRPNRRSKIKYLASKRSISLNSFENFVDTDVEDLMNLFRSLNDGTHGSAGTFNISQLLKLKNRVEDSILFITSLTG